MCGTGHSRRLLRLSLAGALKVETPVTMHGLRSQINVIPLYVTPPNTSPVGGQTLKKALAGNIRECEPLHQVILVQDSNSLHTFFLPFPLSFSHSSSVLVISNSETIGVIFLCSC